MTSGLQVPPFPFTIFEFFLHWSSPPLSLRRSSLPPTPLTVFYCELGLPTPLPNPLIKANSEGEIGVGRIAASWSASWPFKNSLPSGKAGSFGLGPMSKCLVDLGTAKRGLWRHPKNSGYPLIRPRGPAPLCVPSTKERRCLGWSPARPRFILNDSICPGENVLISFSHAWGHQSLCPCFLSPFSGSATRELDFFQVFCLQKVARSRQSTFWGPRELSGEGRTKSVFQEGKRNFRSWRKGAQDCGERLKTGQG